ncbi:type I secretion system permease/ATPase [Stenotrophomonas panacihumi]|nr:type I secretion system permease/ATPase [Stenotrophomonas panacihumi]
MLSGAASLATLAQLHGVTTSYEALLRELDVAASRDGLPAAELVLAARRLGMKCRAVDILPERLPHTPLPAIGLDRHGRYFVLAKAAGSRTLLHDPLDGRTWTADTAELQAYWSGRVLLVQSQASLTGALARFDLSWFIPAIVRHRRVLGEVLVASLALQLFALVTPLFFQVVMDKVLVNRGLSTLDVVSVGLLGVMLFESALSALRAYLLAHTASRLDVELGSRLFRHLVALPLAYFQSRRVGDSVARARELENIRAFLTGSTLTLLLDVLFSVCFLGVMLFYSGWLTLLVLASIPVYVLISLGITPVLRRRLERSFERNAETQALLVETVSGIDTVKAMAVEPQFTRRWDERLAAYVAANFRAQNLANLAGESVSLVGKLVTVGTLWLGARLVIEGQLSVGQLIAFNMLAGRIGQPIMRLAQSWTQFQQTGVSMERLGDILNTVPEGGRADRTVLPALQGAVEFQQVRFRYRPEGEDILHGVDLAIAPGEMIGIVGPSGSGKSTLTRLVQRLYSPHHGRVLVDGIDLANVDVASLRAQIGVVLQENLLFRRSVRDNIALAAPNASMERVMHAAATAGAHEFIAALPQGYDTLVEEHGTSLSGGQRQRIAIARALIGDPRILIFDEATSALDYESERVIHDNMRTIRQGRTVIVIAHRLSAVRDADRIVVMDQGRIVEQGDHHSLRALPGGHYARLQQLQQG